MTGDPSVGLVMKREDLGSSPSTSVMFDESQSLVTSATSGKAGNGSKILLT